MANELHTFTGNEVIATELPELLNQNFNYIQDNSLATVNGVEKDKNNNVDVTFLTSQVIPTNSDLNNFRESGEYTREVDTVVVTNSPTEKPFFLTVLASENLVKQVVTEIDRKDPMTFTRTLSGANWSPWVEGGVDIGVWKSEEAVKVGDVRFLKGRETAGYVLECVTAGITGENQPQIDKEMVEDDVFDLNDFDGTLSIKKGGTGATTAKEACANIGAFPYTGGTLNGNLYVPQSRGYWIAGSLNDNTEALILAARHHGQNYGAFLRLCGEQYSASPSTFQLTAHKNEQSACILQGDGDGNLSWNGARVQTLPQTSQGTTWYRVDNDGWVVQGGWYSNDIKNATYTPVINFPIPFKDKNYFINAMPYNAGYLGEIQAPYGNRTNTGFVLYQYNDNKNEASNGAFWFACGWKA